MLSGVSLRTKSHAAGTIFEAEKEYSGCAVPNTIVVAYIGLGGTSGYNGGASLANICWDGGGADGDRGFIKSGFITLGGMYPANRETTAHEVAHVLGWMHRSRPAAVPRPSIMYPAGNTGLEKLLLGIDRRGKCFIENAQLAVWRRIKTRLAIRLIGLFRRRPMRFKCLECLWNQTAMADPKIGHLPNKKWCRGAESNCRHHDF